MLISGEKLFEVILSASGYNYANLLVKGQILWNHSGIQHEDLTQSNGNYVIEGNL